MAVRAGSLSIAAQETEAADPADKVCTRTPDPPDFCRNLHRHKHADGQQETGIDHCGKQIRR